MKEEGKKNEKRGRTRNGRAVTGRSFKSPAKKVKQIVGAWGREGDGRRGR